MYPSGSRGSPAKGVVRETAARVQISPSAPKRKVLKSVGFKAFFFVFEPFLHIYCVQKILCTL